MWVNTASSTIISFTFPLGVASYALATAVTVSSLLGISLLLPMTSMHSNRLVAILWLCFQTTAIRLARKSLIFTTLSMTCLGVEGATHNQASGMVLFHRRRMGKALARHPYERHLLYRWVEHTQLCHWVEVRLRWCSPTFGQGRRNLIRQGEAENLWHTSWRNITMLSLGTNFSSWLLNFDFYSW